MITMVMMNQIISKMTTMVETIMMRATMIKIERRNDTNDGDSIATKIIPMIFSMVTVAVTKNNNTNDEDNDERLMAT